MITIKRLLEREFDVSCDNEAFLEQALTHRSASKRNNERMEFLGDAVLGMVIADALFCQHHSLSEGELTRARARIVKRESLATAARRIGLGAYLILGPGELRSGGRERGSILADAMEALFGAVYLHCGIESARQFVIGALDVEIVASVALTTGRDKDPKTTLQEFLQARKYGLPLYSVISVQGQDHDQSFSVECLIPELTLSVSAQGTSRRQAEQTAAALALQLIKEKTTT